MMAPGPRILQSVVILYFDCFLKGYKKDRLLMASVPRVCFYFYMGFYQDFFKVTSAVNVPQGISERGFEQF